MVVVNVILYKEQNGRGIVAESYELGQMSVESDSKRAVEVLEDNLRVLIDGARETPNTALLYASSGELTEGLTRVLRDGGRYSRPGVREIPEHIITLHNYDFTRENLSSPRQQLPPVVKREWSEAR